MAALCVDIADSVVALIDAAATARTLNQPIFVERQWVETQRLENLQELDPARIIVVPRVLNVSAFDLRPRNAYDWDVGVWFDRLVETDKSLCDPMAELVEQIVRLLAENRDLLIAQPPGHAQFIRITPEPTYDSSMLLDTNVFRSVFVATYRVTR